MAAGRKPAIAGSAAVAPPKSKPTKALKAKKPTDSKKDRAHPPYAEMISEAIVALKERTGSSQIAIAKFIEEKQKASNLAPNFKKLLLNQLKKQVAAGKLVKVKNSFKLAPSTAAVAKKAPAAAPAPAKKKVSAPVVKTVTPVKAKKVAAPKPKAAAKPKKVAKTAAVASPGKKKAATKVKKAAPVKVAKKPKSIKSPVKKAAASKAKGKK
ncbi:hypothetical protein Vadar_021076 [Vaccinium darrowii]|uniref:Uncharacterized protein n=1 Tax=Vaccinium darrowii TaxID=229202 RepID=A0ACB7YZ02_9ERIC|nr:hypothetical protein Vadar_021076 [Vaccinium darrowii]